MHQTKHEKQVQFLSTVANQPSGPDHKKRIDRWKHNLEADQAREKLFEQVGLSGECFGCVLVDAHVSNSQKQKSEGIKCEIEAKLCMPDTILDQIVGQDPSGLDQQVEQYS